MPIKFEEDADDNKFYASFGIPISQVKLAVDSEPITFEVELEGDIVGHWTRITGMSLAPSTAANLNERVVLNKEKTEMKMSEKMAVRLHRMMWADMLEELGDNPTPAAREQFKRNWVEENFPYASVDCNCFLCEYTCQKSQETNSGKRCSTYCPIMWNAKRGAHNSCTIYGTTGISYTLSPISEILALPARNPEYDEKSRPSDYFRGYRSCLDNLARIANDPSGTFKTATDAYTHIYSKGKGEAHISKEAFDGMKRALAEASGKPENATISEHIEGIKAKSDGYKDLVGLYYWKSCYEGVLRKLYNLYNKADILIPFDLSKVKAEDVDWIITRLVDKSVDKGRTEGFEKAAKQMADELDKTFNKGRSSAYDAICKRAGVMGVGIDEIIEAIGKKSVDDFLDEHPQARYWTKTDVDQAFRQYAAEQVRPFLDKLSKESGLRRDLDVGVHVEAVKKKSYDKGFENGKEEGAKETMDKIMNAFKK